MELIRQLEDQDTILVCKLTASDVDSTLKSYSDFMNHKGELYNRCYVKNPGTHHFVDLQFGEQLDCGFLSPDRYMCSNKNVASRLMKVISKLKYHDAFLQKYCDVIQDGKYIDVIYGDY